jgi:putative NIF3 family GTP cyclohydrolase 1 type 2
MDVDLVVTHEPTFFDHFDDVTQVADDPVYLNKRKALEDSGLTVLRIHDSWDSWPVIGIGDSLGKLLGMKETATAGRNYKCYTMNPRTLDAFAAFVRDKLSMDAVGVMGDGSQKVERVGLSFGAIGGIPAMRKFLSMDPDVIVAGELCNWRDIRYLQDAGCSVILTDHGVSENPGMRSLAKFLAKQFKIKATYVDVPSAFRTVGKSIG